MLFRSYIEEFSDKNIKMVLFGMSERVVNTFEILGLSELLVIVENKEEAKKRLV